MQSARDPVLDAFDAGRARWPLVSLAYETFAARLRGNGACEGDIELHAADLYLASACAEGDPVALRLFEEQFIKNVDLYVSRCGLTDESRDQVRQKVRVKLLLGPTPGIRRYRGQGPLTSLVRVTAVRVAGDIAAALGAADRQRSDPEILDRMVSADATPEVATAKALYQDRFRAALLRCLAALSAREKTLIRLHFMDGLSLEGIGVLYGVHRATVARWLLAIRNQVFAELRRQLSVQLGATPSELRSLVQLFRDDIDLSARHVLATELAAPAR